MLLSLLFTNPLVFLVAAGALVVSLTIHEFAHAWIADKLGDPTARLQGRVTLNPLAHLDPLGTILLLVAGFGWGKPVEFDPFNLANPKRDAALVALAGPASNLLLAALLSGTLHLFGADNLLSAIILPVLFVNVSLAIFNLVPIYPLDGSKILLALLPAQSAIEYDEIMHRYGSFLLLLLILPLNGGRSAVSFLISPVIQTITSLLLTGV